jgi:hydrogenase maturation protease
MTSCKARIIGVGQALGGDDGAGLAVLRRLRETAPPEIELVEVAEPSQLIALLTDGAQRIVVVDALLDSGAAGRVVAIDPSVAKIGGRSLSSHGISLLEAIELARIIAPENIAPKIAIIGITIRRPTIHGQQLSASVEAAVGKAAAQALRLAQRPNA